MTKILVTKDKIIFKGHSSTKEKCGVITNIVNTLAKSNNFKEIKNENGYAEFESLKNDELKFPPMRQYSFYNHDGTQMYFSDGTYDPGNETIFTLQNANTIYGIDSSGSGNMNKTDQSGTSLNNDVIISSDLTTATFPFIIAGIATSVNGDIVYSVGDSWTVSDFGETKYYIVKGISDNLQTKTMKLINYAKSQLSSMGVTSTATTLRGTLDDITNISAARTYAALNAPTISLNGSILILTNPSTNGNFATGFNIYNDSTKITTQLIDVTTLDLSTLLTDAGIYTITAKCYGTDMDESNASASVTYTITAGATVMVNYIAQSPDIYTTTVSGSNNGITELTSGNNTILVTPNNTLTISGTGDNLYYSDLTGNMTVQSSDFDNVVFLVTGDASVTIDIYCFVKGTLISMADGTFKKVEDINYNDEVKGWNFDNGEQGSGKVFWIMQPQISNNYWNIMLSNETEIKLVGSNGKSHRFLNATKGKFMYPQDFEKDDLTYDGINNEFVKIVKCENIKEEVEYYNFAVSNILNNYANGILCGSRFSNIYPIKDMKFIKDNRQLVSREEYAEIPDYLYDGLRLSEQSIKDSDDNVKYCNTMKEYIKILYVNKAKETI